MLDSPTDARLVERARKGDGAAFAEIVSRHGGTIYSVCYRLAGEPAAAEDLAQEAFLRLYRTLDKFRPDAELRPWLYRLTANVCLDALRRREAATTPLDVLAEAGAEPSVERPDEQPEVALLRREERLDVQRALLQLPADYRAALVLRYLEDLSYREIADALGVPVSTVETRIFRAKRMLAEIVAPTARSEGATTSEKGAER